MNEQKPNMLLAVIGLVGLLGAVYLSLNFLLEILTILKTLGAVVVVAVITGFVTIITTVYKAFWDIKQARLHYLNQKRENAYFHFVEMIYKINQSGKGNFRYTTDQQIKDLLKFSKEITLWGSKNVVEYWKEFRRVANSNSNSDGKELLKISEKIMNEMRHDLGVSRVKEKALLSFFINDIHNLD